MPTPWFVWALWVQRSPLSQDRRVDLESPDPLRRPAVGSSGTQPATVGVRTSALGGSHPQAISRSCPHCSLRHHDRDELRSSDTRESSTHWLTPWPLSESRIAVASPQVHLDRE